jgi:AcrR family transcriptional regulator
VVDHRIRKAALKRFAVDGYEGTSMGAIAATATFATGNLYRYYPDGKQPLFEAVATEELAHTLESLVRERGRALLLPLHGSSGESPQAAQLLDFWVEHRLEVIVFLNRVAGTRFADYGARFVELLVDLAIERLRDHGTDPDPDTRHLLHTIFANTRQALVAILEHHEGHEAIRHAIGGFPLSQGDALAERSIMNHEDVPVANAPGDGLGGGAGASADLQHPHPGPQGEGVDDRSQA